MNIHDLNQSMIGLHNRIKWMRDTHQDLDEDLREAEKYAIEIRQQLIRMAEDTAKPIETPVEQWAPRKR